MQKKMQYLTLVIALVLVLFLLVSGLYQLYLNFVEFGGQCLLSNFWWISSILVLGVVATMGGRKAVLGYYLGEQLETWENYEVSWLVWVVWQSFKILLFGWLLSNTIFGMGLHAGFTGMQLDPEATLLFMGPLLTAIIVRIVLYVIGELPGIATDRLFAMKFLTVLCLFLAIYSLQGTSPITGFKVQIFVGLFVVGLILLGLDKASMAPVLGILVFIGLIGPVIQEQFIIWPIVDPNMRISGVQAIETINLDGGLNRDKLDKLKEEAGYVRNWDLETAAGKLSSIKLEAYEKFGEAQVWFGEGKEYWVFPQLLAEGPPVSNDWETMHVFYTKSSGITMIDPRTGEFVDSKDFFPQQEILFGTGGGYEYWAVGDLEDDAGIGVGAGAQLFDWELGGYLPGKLIRFKEVHEKLNILFPYLILGEPQLVSGEGETFYSVALIAELDSGWIPGAKVPYLQEIGKALVNTRTGEIRLVKGSQDPVGIIIQDFYDFEDAPQWFVLQQKYPQNLLLKQLKAIDLYFPIPLSTTGITPGYLYLESGPALVLPIRTGMSKEILGYIQVECGEFYGNIKVYKFGKNAHPASDIPDMISNSMHRIPEVGTELGTYITTGRPKLGKPAFYPLLERGYYFTPIYVKQETRNILRYVVVTDAETGALGVGNDALGAIEDMVG